MIFIVAGTPGFQLPLMAIWQNKWVIFESGLQTHAVILCPVVSLQTTKLHFHIKVGVQDVKKHLSSFCFTVKTWSICHSVVKGWMSPQKDTVGSARFLGLLFSPQMNRTSKTDGFRKEGWADGQHFPGEARCNKLRLSFSPAAPLPEKTAARWDGACTWLQGMTRRLACVPLIQQQCSGSGVCVWASVIMSEGWCGEACHESAEGLHRQLCFIREALTAKPF